MFFEEMGCDQIQGCYISRPVDGATLQGILNGETPIPSQDG